MTERSPIYQAQNQSGISKAQLDVEQAQSQRDGLVVECLILLLQVSRRPNALKLLAGVKDQLQIFAGYKATRRR